MFKAKLGPKGPTGPGPQGTLGPGPEGANWARAPREPEAAERELEPEPARFGSKPQEPFGTEPNRGLPGLLVEPYHKLWTPEQLEVVPADAAFSRVLSPNFLEVG